MRLRGDAELRRPSCQGPPLATRPSVKPLKRGLRSFSVRSTAAVSTGASDEAREVERGRERLRVEVPDRDETLLVRRPERVPLVRVQLDGDLALDECEGVASGAVICGTQR